ncbi:MAG: hypothetical protein K2X32_04735 [Phycisphaerales bacterium]|nr:hypothetical protein [Phycisphaerales bacterium]
MAEVKSISRPNLADLVLITRLLAFVPGVGLALVISSAIIVHGVAAAGENSAGPTGVLGSMIARIYIALAEGPRQSVFLAVGYGVVFVLVVVASTVPAHRLARLMARCRR